MISSIFRNKLLRKSLFYSFIAFKWLIITLIICGFLIAGAAIGYVSALVKDDPVRPQATIVSQLEANDISGFVYFNDQSLVGQLRSDQDRRLATLNEIPQKVIDATLSIEDKNFFIHSGIDMSGFLRAVDQKLRHQPVQTGGSTITQQLVRRTFLSLDVSYARKFKEILLSFRVERFMSKDEILLAYLNKIPYGNGSNGYEEYGIKAAAEGIFGKDLSQLNIAQSAYLAGLPQSPSNYSAFTSKGTIDEDKLTLAITRQRLVLKQMLANNKLTEAQYEDALDFDIRGSLAPTKQKAYNTYPYLMIQVENDAADIILKQQYPNLTDDDFSSPKYEDALKSINDQLEHNGYKIYTTIDKSVYNAMQNIAANKANFIPDDKVKGMVQIGAIMLDNKTSAILGFIGGRDFYTEQINHATQTYRQPGSAMKPIAAYTPALEEGLIQPASVIDDVPIILKDPSQKSGFFIPQNWNSHYQGLITARVALNQSYNIPAIRLFLNEVGIKTAWDYAKKMGINSITPQDYYSQTGVIGGLYKGVSVKELTNAYATIANQGIYNQVYLISKIEDANGNVIYQHTNKPTTVFSKETAYLMTDMMRTVISDGTAVSIKSTFKHYGKIPVVGKTGSTQDDTDAWFEGYSPDITVGVWAGYDQPVNKLVKPGTSTAKNIWSFIMDAAMNVKPQLFSTTQFDRPADIVSMTVSNLSGELPSALTIATKHVVTDLFNKKYIPTETDDVLANVNFVSFNGKKYIPNVSMPAEFVQTEVAVKRSISIADLLSRIQQIMNVTPTDQKKPISVYMPIDMANDAPDQIDPRVDDGLIPDAPSSLRMTYAGTGFKLTFNASKNPNVVGYRLYRSIDHEKFQLVDGNVIDTGQATVFHDNVPATDVGYYVTAVNIAGKESAPSLAAYSDGEIQVPITDPTNPSVNNTPVVANIPSSPSGLKLSKNGMYLQFNWNANPANQQVQTYNIYYSQTQNGTSNEIGTVSGLPTFTYYAKVLDGFYSVTAVNVLGESPPSSPVAYSNPA